MCLEHDFKSYYYVLVWITCRYAHGRGIDGRSLTEWLDICGSTALSRARKPAIKYPKSLTVTQVHRGAATLIPKFADFLVECLDDRRRGCIDIATVGSRYPRAQPSLRIQKVNHISENRRIPAHGQQLSIVQHSFP